MPQVIPGNYRLEVRVAAELGPQGDLMVEFRGAWDRYRRVNDGLEAVLGQPTRLERLEASAALEFGFDGATGTVERLGRIRQILRTLNRDGSRSSRAQPRSKERCASSRYTSCPCPTDTTG